VFAKQTTVKICHHMKTTFISNLQTQSLKWRVKQEE